MFSKLRAATILLTAILNATASAASQSIILQSPGGQNQIRLEANAQENAVKYSVGRGGAQVIEPSAIEPILTDAGSLVAGARLIDIQRDQLDETFNIPWGKTTTVVNHSSRAVATIATRSNIRWEIELRAYDDGVAFRYRIPAQNGLGKITLREEATEFRPAGRPQALFNTLNGFTTSHESLYERKPLTAIPIGRLIDMPVLLTWPNGTAAAITEARVLKFAGMYLERPKADDSRLRGRLSPLPSSKNACVTAKPPVDIPWRVVLLGDSAGKLLESNLLLRLNDPPRGDFEWSRPGKTTFH
jgi:alpha-glucosidase